MSWIKSETDVLPCCIHIPLCLFVVIYLDSRVGEKNTGLRDEMLLKVTEHLVHGPCH